MGAGETGWQERETMSTKIETIITDEQIKALRTEARSAGDAAQVRICNDALSGDDDARVECARVIADAAAMGE